MSKFYLGDSVYVELDGYGIILTTENGLGPSNTIYLDAMTLIALFEWMKANGFNVKVDPT